LHATATGRFSGLCLREAWCDADSAMSRRFVSATPDRSDAQKSGSANVHANQRQGVRIHAVTVCTTWEVEGTFCRYTFAWRYAQERPG